MFTIGIQRAVKSNVIIGGLMRARWKECIGESVDRVDVVTTRCSDGFIHRTGPLKDELRIDESHYEL